MRKIYKIAENNSRIFFKESYIQSSVVFKVDDSLIDSISELANENGWIIDNFDSSSNVKIKNIKSLYPTINENNSHQYRYILKMNDEFKELELKRLKKEGYYKDNTVLYKNSSDDPFLYNKRFKILDVIPKGNMTNTQKDCCRIIIETPYKRSDHPVWENKTPEQYKQWAIKFEKGERSSLVKPDDIISKELVVPIDCVSTI